MDLTLDIGNGVYNLRVSALVRNGSKFLMDSVDGLIFPIGGRVKLNETIEEALAREVMEETNCSITFYEMKGIGESSFFSKAKNANVFEHNFIFEVVLDGDIPSNLKWVSIDDDSYVPQYLKDVDHRFIHNDINDLKFTPVDVCKVVNNHTEFNVRISAVIRNSGKVLFDKSAYDKKHLVPIGGRMQMGESFEEALAREVKEELGVEINESNFLGYGQDFFELNLNEDSKKPIHFISFVYEVEVDLEKIEFGDGCCGVWMDTETIGDIHMNSIKKYL